ncbi:hypothetical protein HDV00_006380 [Rhizophlyctis rosea]|nr:hypothetical protein HDV00_006380 [Rhizophlyctis rosea]
MSQNVNTPDRPSSSTAVPPSDLNQLVAHTSMEPTEVGEHWNEGKLIVTSIPVAGETSGGQNVLSNETEEEELLSRNPSHIIRPQPPQSPTTLTQQPASDIPDQNQLEVHEIEGPADDERSLDVETPSFSFLQGAINNPEANIDESVGTPSSTSSGNNRTAAVIFSPPTQTKHARLPTGQNEKTTHNATAKLADYQSYTQNLILDSVQNVLKNCHYKPDGVYLHASQNTDWAVTGDNWVDVGTELAKIGYGSPGNNTSHLVEVGWESRKRKFAKVGPVDDPWHRGLEEVPLEERVRMGLWRKCARRRRKG